MTKTLLTGMAVCLPLALFAGNANAYTMHAKHTNTTRTTSTWSSLMAKGGPLHDCVHVTFPQCSPHGPDQPNH